MGVHTGGVGRCAHLASCAQQAAKVAVTSEENRGEEAKEEVLLLGMICVATQLVLWVLMHIKGTLTFEWNLWCEIGAFVPSFLLIKKFKINTENQNRLFGGDRIASLCFM